jgi:hypothetical protein
MAGSPAFEDEAPIIAAVRRLARSAACFQPSIPAFRRIVAWLPSTKLATKVTLVPWCSGNTRKQGVTLAQSKE